MPDAQPDSSRPFLTARWSNLGLVTYAVDPALLATHLPPACELDLRDGSAFVSFVVFDFLETRVRGIRWPGLVNFPEINLRFYVRCGGQRGVCFIRELVPSRLIAWVARTIYNEPYVRTRMRSEIGTDKTLIETNHHFWFAGKEHIARVRGRRATVRPAEDSVEHFFKEHEWGFGTSRAGALRRYRVQHPVWSIYPDATAELHVDFAAVYGEKWGFLKRQQPFSVVFAEGSEVAVYPHSDTAT